MSGLHSSVGLKIRKKIGEKNRGKIGKNRDLLLNVNKSNLVFYDSNILNRKKEEKIGIFFLKRKKIKSIFFLIFLKLICPQK